MPSLSNKTDLRGISLTYEGTYGNEEVTSSNILAYPYRGQPLEVKPVHVFTDGETANGTLGVSRMDIITQEINESMEMELHSDLVSQVLHGLANSQSEATTSPESYTSLLYSQALPTLKSRNVVERYGTELVQYTGCVFTGFSVSISASDNNKIGKLTIPIRGYHTLQTSPTVTYANLGTQMVSLDGFLSHGDTSFLRGAAFSSANLNTGITAWSTVDDFTSKMESVEYGVNYPLLESALWKAGTTSSGTRVKSYRVTPELAGPPSVTLKAKVRCNNLDDSTDDWYTEMIAETEFSIRVSSIGKVISSGVYSTVQATFPNVRIKSCPLVKEDGIYKRDVEFEVLMRRSDSGVSNPWFLGMLTTSATATFNTADNS